MADYRIRKQYKKTSKKHIAKLEDNEISTRAPANNSMELLGWVVIREMYFTKLHSFLFFKPWQALQKEFSSNNIQIIQYLKAAQFLRH